MPPSSGELWGYHLMPPQVYLDCLLPNGVLVPLMVNRDEMLSSVKELLWVKIKNFPLAHIIAEQSSYIFVSVAQDAKIEEFYDETRRLCDLKLFQPFLKLVEPEGNREEKILNSEISLAMGFPVTDLEELKDTELIEFRHNLFHVCKEAIQERGKYGDMSDLLYYHPPDVEMDILPTSLQATFQQDTIIVCIWLPSADSDNKHKITLKVLFDATPIEVIRKTQLRKQRSLPNLSNHDGEGSASDNNGGGERRNSSSESYVLKVCGCEQYLIGNYPVCQYKYIRLCLTKGLIPQLLLVKKSKVLSQIPPSKFTTPSFVRRGFLSRNNSNCLSLWRLDLNKFHVRILWATYVNARELDQLYVKVGLFLGPEPLCPVNDTQQVIFSIPKWNCWLEFDIYMPDIPRNARICLSLCCVSSRKKKGKEEHCALAWGNLNIFDYNGVLRSDKVSLNLWPLPQGMDNLLYPLGICGSNPDKDSTCLGIEFDKLNNSFMYPPDEDVHEYASHVIEFDHTARLTKPSSSEIEQLREISQRDPLYELSEQDKELLWAHRFYLCNNIPESISKLIQSTKWSSRDEVAQLYLLLHKWPYLTNHVTALGLLDCMYADGVVREYAVRSLEKTLTVDRLSDILLQLIQVLKYEPYADNPLAKFILKQALLNRRVGHFLFWHIKSEMQYESSNNYPYALLLESYCRGCGANLKVLSGQVEVLDKLTLLTYALKDMKDESLRKKYLFEHIDQKDYLESMRNFPSPIDNSCILGDLHVTSCRVLTSAKRPLWLVWKNQDVNSDIMYQTQELIFKNGDDLRQDMLTLQVISVMDRIWKNEGMDLKMMPYAVLSMGKQVGVIGVVKNAETVYGIQKKGGKVSASQVDSKQLHRWIKENNKAEKYDKAIELFTLSCAGYCVATFVLGIRDRHPQNIMVTEDGQIFHIDFGHFLHHIKRKYGIKRERVPFILTEDFIRVIAKGADNPQRSKEFENFQETCGKAYICLRRHSDLLITLFTMMLSAGIPELQTLEDLEYLRKTLAVDMSEKKALEYFQSVFNEAYNGAWTAKVDWFFHFVKHL